MPASIDRAMHEPGIFEHLHVLRCAGQRHRQRFGQFADGQLSQREPRQHLAASRMGERLKHVVDARIAQTLNHMVEDIRAFVRLSTDWLNV